MAKDRRIDAYIADAAPFARPILKHLRALVHAACPGVTETQKWSMPFFEHNGNLCFMAAFREHAGFGFWNSERIFGDAGGKEGAMGNFGRLTSVSDLPSDTKLKGLIKKGVRLNTEATAKKTPARKRTSVSSRRATTAKKRTKARSS